MLQGGVFRSPPWLRLIWLALGFLVLAFVLVQLRSVLTPVALALLLAYVLNPLVDKFETMGIQRSLGIAIILFAVLLALTLFIILVVPQLVRDVLELLRALSIGLVKLVSGINPWLREHNIPVPPNVSTALDKLGENAISMATSAVAPAGDVLLAAIGGTANALGSLSNALFVPVFAFFFLHDFESIKRTVKQLLPAGIRPGVISVFSQVDVVLGHFIRGQLTVMGILAALYAFGYSVIGVPLAVPIGVLAGVLSFIPYVGSTLALVLGLLMVVLHWTGFAQLIGVVVVYAFIQLLEGLVITPRVVGGKLGLSTVWVLFALLAFGKLFGFLGVMLALPASAVIKVFVVDALAYYQRSALYLGEPLTRPVALRPGRLRLRRIPRPRTTRRLSR